MQNPYAGDEHTPLPDQTPQSQQSPQFPPSRSYSYLNEQYGQFGQPPSQSMPPTYQSYQPSPQPAPGQFQPPPATPTARPSRGLRTGAILALTVVLALVFGVGLFAGWQFGRTGTISSPTSSSSSNTPFQQGNTSSTVPALTGNNLEAVREAVVAKVRPAVVQVNVTTGNGNAIGSGVIIDARGYIVTNNHVVNGAQRLEVVLFDGTRLSAQLVGTDAADDLAVIKVTPPKNGLTTIKIGDSSKLQVGQDVLAVGNPLGITQTVTNGIISALGRSVSEGQGGATLPDAIQTDAPINPGNSGGALVDLQGNLIGIPTLTAIDPEFNTPANGVGFAIPSNRIAFIVPQIIQNGVVTHTGRAVLGISATSVDASLAAQDNLSVDHGALIRSLVSGGPAASAGLQVGDVIVQINNKAVNDLSSLTDALLTKNPGDTVAVHIYRGSQQLTINVHLGELQAG
ncbi:MAG TPA: trypsin-like peptidase domain-containing protein [Ktedonobacteraceae bacterium]|nr:trypsin-like peptidase domain-containing protein [Ktedonobacteraceae bacterium]